MPNTHKTEAEALHDALRATRDDDDDDDDALATAAIDELFLVT